jgi:Fe2+ or Zn2+ uptake regulation protein
MVLDLHATATDRLQRDGQRYTGNRRTLIDVLRNADRPLTIAEVLERDGSLAQSSVYRNLTVLEHAGVVSRVHSTDEFARFELAEDLLDHHHHLICSRCGRVEDFRVAASIEQSLVATLEQAVKHTGFSPEHHRLDLVGRCADCAP